MFKSSSINPATFDLMLTKRCLSPISGHVKHFTKLIAMPKMNYLVFHLERPAKVFVRISEVELIVRFIETLILYLLLCVIQV